MTTYPDDWPKKEKEPVMLWVATGWRDAPLAPAPASLPLPADRKVDRIDNECSMCETVYKPDPDYEYCPECGSPLFVKVRVTNASP